MTSLPSEIQEYLQQKMSLALHYHIQLSGNYFVYVNKNGILEESSGINLLRNRNLGMRLKKQKKKTKKKNTGNEAN